MVVMTLTGVLTWRKLPDGEETAERSLVKGYMSAGLVPTSLNSTQDCGMVKSPGGGARSVDTPKTQVLGKEMLARGGVTGWEHHGWKGQHTDLPVDPNPLPRWSEPHPPCLQKTRLLGHKLGCPSKQAGQIVRVKLTSNFFSFLTDSHYNSQNNI